VRSNASVEENGENANEARSEEMTRDLGIPWRRGFGADGSKRRDDARTRVNTTAKSLDAAFVGVIVAISRNPTRALGTAKEIELREGLVPRTGDLRLAAASEKHEKPGREHGEEKGPRYERPLEQGIALTSYY